MFQTSSKTWISSFAFKNYDSYFDQVQLLEENQGMLEQRNKEIVNIVRSIQDLNELFKDLATMIVDQVYFKENKQSSEMKSF